MENELKQAIEHFAKTFGRDGHDFGNIELSLDANEVPADLPVTGQIKAFYKNTTFDKLFVYTAPLKPDHFIE